MQTSLNHIEYREKYTNTFFLRGLKKKSLLVLLMLFSLLAYTQEKRKVEFQAARMKQSENIANGQLLLDHVVIKHKDILMYCDSAITYEGTNKVDAFGHVHINKADSVHLYASEVYYDGDKSFAKAKYNVKLLNKEATLYTDTLDYDMELNIGYYNQWGKIVDSTNTLTSQKGKYLVNENLAHFTDSVVGYNPKYILNSDDIQYNTQTEIIFFKGPTTIKDSTSTLYAEDGWYNTQTGDADLRLMPRMYNKTQLLTAQKILYDKQNGNGQAFGHGHLEDFENRTIVNGNYVTYNEITEIATAIDSAVFIAYDNKDSLYLHADTLRTQPDTIEGEKTIKAYYGVRFYRTDMQGVCDSLIYFTKDSLIQMFVEPILWSEVHQMTAERIEFTQHANAPDEMRLFNNSFIISEQDSGKFDQIKGKDMIGYIINNKLDHIDVDGNGQTIYYAREGNGTLIGLNHAESSNIKILLKEGKVFKIVFLKQPEGNLKPVEDIDEGEKRLSGFKLFPSLRPLSPDDIYEKPTETGEEKGNMKQQSITVK